MIRVGEGGRYRCENGVDTGERLGRMQVTGGGGYGCEMEGMTSGRTWWIRVYDRDGYRCAFGEEVKGGLA